MQLTSFLHEAATAASLCTSAAASWTRCSAAASSSWWSCFRDAHAVPLSPEASPLKASNSYRPPDTGAFNAHSGCASTDSQTRPYSFKLLISPGVCMRKHTLYMEALYLLAVMCWRMLQRTEYTTDALSGTWHR